MKKRGASGYGAAKLFHEVSRTLRAQYDFAPGVPLFECAVGLPDFVERVHISDGDLQVTVSNEISQFCQHTGIGGLGVAGCSDPNVLTAAKSMMVSTRGGGTPRSVTPSFT